MLKPFPICQIIPPHILNNIVERGKKEQRARAMQSLTLSARIRGQRDITSLLPIHAVAGTKRRTIYNTHRSETLPGTRVRGEGGKPVRNRAVNEAYDYCGDVYDFYKAVCDRNSVDEPRAAPRFYGALRRGLRQRILERQPNGLRRRRWRNLSALYKVHRCHWP